MSKPAVNIFWLRRDLRIEDNTALYHALNSDLPVLLLFIFDSNILDDLEKDDPRVNFIHQELLAIDQHLKKHQSGVLILHGEPQKIWKQLLSDYAIEQVFINKDYEPYALQRDKAIENLLAVNDIGFNAYKDHVLLEPHEVLKADQSPYVVFTPYSRVWRSTLKPEDLQARPSEELNNYYQGKICEPPSLLSLGFKSSTIPIPDKGINETLLKNYATDRDYPAKRGTSKLGIHLRFGTISIRALARKAKGTSDVYLNELIWREFYQMILWHFPSVVNQNFKKQYDQLEWRNNEEEFKAWCDGNTGYPIVDAGMRELNSTGFMHNRMRMVTASFLTKHLLIDWRWGEAYFAQKLLDFELASNNGGWQWAAGTGTDAQPYFRIFNPESQTKKFDSDLEYIKKWVPEFQELSYPKPIVDHKLARERCLETYKKALSA